MLPNIRGTQYSSSNQTIKRRKDIKSPKTDREYKSDVLSNQLSPRQKFKPIDFKENLVISINCTEAMRVKEYEKLCQLSTKFEHKKVKNHLKVKDAPKEFGHYAKKDRKFYL